MLGAQPSLATSDLSWDRRAAAVGKRKRNSLLCPSSEGARKRGVSLFRCPCFARQADGLSMGTTGGPKECRPPSDYNTPPSRSSSEPFLTSLFSTTIRPSLSLSLSKARKLIPLSWDRRGIFLLFVSSLPFYLSSPVFVRPQGPANRRLVSLAPSALVTPSTPKTCPCLHSYYQRRRPRSRLEHPPLMWS
jgi:hypothetical protein